MNKGGHKGLCKGRGGHGARGCIPSLRLGVSGARLEHGVWVMLLGSWKCGQGRVSGCSPCILPHGSHPFLSQVSGAVLVSGLVQLLLGVSGMCGWAARHCGPMVLAPSLSIIGLSAYKEAALFCSTNWGVALLYVSLGATPVCGPRGFPSPWGQERGIPTVHGMHLGPHRHDAAW